MGVQCPMGQGCAQGACVSTSCGPDGTACPTGQACAAAGGCVPTACATVMCPTGYACSAGLCLPSLPDGGIPRLPDGGAAVVIGPDGGVVGVPGADGGLSRLPDGGAVGGPCLPWACSEVACNNGVDDNGNGLVDCADPSCEAQRCSDGDTCTFGDTCSAGQCQPATTLSCTMPPTGPCWNQRGTCLANGSCRYSVNFSRTCPGMNMVCQPDGMCGQAPSVDFGFVTANVDPAQLPRFTDGMVTINGQATFDSTGITFGGGWQGRPATAEVMTPSGPAVVLIFDQLTLNSGSRLRLTGNRPVIFLAYTNIGLINAVIDASGQGTTPGPAGNLNCGMSTGGAGSSNNSTASGGGGGGSFRTAGGRGGGGSTFSGGGGTAGALRQRSRFALIGGCPGGTGGGTQGGVGGAGGGAVQLIARFGIYMDDSRILVNGAGGVGAGNQNQGGPGGGGGGGSGGTIILQSPYVGIGRSTILSNGGGGGEGAGIVDLGFSFGGGRSGEDGNLIPGFLGAAGGSGGSFNGGNGGNGGAALAAAGDGQNGNRYVDNDNNSSWEAGGGGGGGAAGAVLVDVPMGALLGFQECLIVADSVLSPVRDVSPACGG